MCSNFTRFAGLTGAGFCRAQIVLDSSKLYCTYYPVLSYMLFHVFTQSSSSQSSKSSIIKCHANPVNPAKSSKLLCIDKSSDPLIQFELDLKLFLLESISKSQYHLLNFRIIFSISTRVEIAEVCVEIGKV